MCNSLLRRVGKTMAAEWSGRVMEVVASMMTLDERGGLNLGGKCNVDNHTSVEKPPKKGGGTGRSGREGKEGEGEGKEGGGGEPMIDYEFYRTLWSLQAVFSDPSQLKHGEMYGSFTSSLTAVLDAFERSPPSSMGPTFTFSSSSSSAAAYFPKYLSGSRLLNLQLLDATFRRQLLTQCLILFQYLLNPFGDAAPPLTAAAPPLPSPASTSGPAPAQPLTAVQLEVVREFVPRVLQLLEATGEGRGADGGDGYGQRLLAVLHDELAWMRWKVNKAPSFARPPADMLRSLLVPGGTAKGKERRPKRARGAEAPVMGGEKLAELWGSVLSNEESVVDGNRGFSPLLQSKLDELLEEEDDWQERKRKAAERKASRASVKPEGQAEGAERLTDEVEGETDEELDEKSLLRNDKQRQWTLLRLLRRSDFVLFQKADGGSLDGVVEELKRRRQAEEEKNHQPTTTQQAEPDHTAIKQERNDETKEKPIKQEDGGTEEAAGSARAIKAEDSAAAMKEEPFDEAAELKVEEDVAVDGVGDAERLAEMEGPSVEGEHDGGEDGDGEEEGEDADEPGVLRIGGEGGEQHEGDEQMPARKRRKDEDDDNEEERRKRQRTEEEAMDGGEESFEPQPFADHDNRRTATGRRSRHRQTRRSR